MIDRARVEAQNHWFLYNERMKVESVALAVSNLAIQFGDADAETAMVSLTGSPGEARDRWLGLLYSGYKGID